MKTALLLSLAAARLAAAQNAVTIEDPVYHSLTAALVAATDSAAENSILADLNNYMDTMSKSYYTPTVDGVALTAYPSTFPSTLPSSASN